MIEKIIIFIFNNNFLTMSETYNYKSKREIKKLPVTEIEIFLDRLQTRLDLRFCKETYKLEKLVREILLEKYSDK